MDESLQGSGRRRAVIHGVSRHFPTRPVSPRRRFNIRSEPLLDGLLSAFPSNPYLEQWRTG